MSNYFKKDQGPDGHVVNSEDHLEDSKIGMSGGKAQMQEEFIPKDDQDTSMLFQRVRNDRPLKPAAVVIKFLDINHECEESKEREIENYGETAPHPNFGGAHGSNPFQKVSNLKKTIFAQDEVIWNIG